MKDHLSHVNSCEDCVSSKKTSESALSNTTYRSNCKLLGRRSVRPRHLLDIRQTRIIVNVVPTSTEATAAIRITALIGEDVVPSVLGFEVDLPLKEPAINVLDGVGSYPGGVVDVVSSVATCAFRPVNVDSASDGIGWWWIADLILDTFAAGLFVPDGVFVLWMISLSAVGLRAGRLDVLGIRVGRAHDWDC